MENLGEEVANLRRSLSLLQEYVHIKFGSDFREFLGERNAEIPSLRNQSTVIFNYSNGKSTVTEDGLEEEVEMHPENPWEFNGVDVSNEDEDEREFRVVKVESVESSEPEYITSEYLEQRMLEDEDDDEDKEEEDDGEVMDVTESERDPDFSPVVIKKSCIPPPIKRPVGRPRKIKIISPNFRKKLLTAKTGSGKRGRPRKIQITPPNFKKELLTAKTESGNSNSFPKTIPKPKGITPTIVAKVGGNNDRQKIYSSPQTISIPTMKALNGSGSSNGDRDSGMIGALAKAIVKGQEMEVAIVHPSAFPQEGEITTEVPKYTVIDPICCGECGKIFTNHCKFLRHQYQHGPKRFKCEGCGKAFRYPDYLPQHKADHCPEEKRKRMERNSTEEF